MSATHKLNSLWLGLLATIFAGCEPLEPVTSTAMSAPTTSAVTSPVISTAQRPAGTSTPIATLTGEHCVPKLIPVTDDTVSRVQWSADESALYYNLQDAPDAWWAFDPASNTTNPLSAKPILNESMPDAIDRVIPEIVDRELVSVSPDGKNAVYGIKVYSSPTPIPDTAGESGGPSEFQYELFLVKPGATSPVSLGQFAGLLEGFTWFADSSAFLVHNSARIPVSAYTWLADVSWQTLVPLLVATPDIPEKRFVDLAEDGTVVLYEGQQALHLYNPGAGTDQEILSLPDGRFYAWFLDNTHILVIDDREESLRFTAYIYDSAAGELTRVSEDTFAADELKLSPNRRYVGIVDMQSGGLQVLPLCRQSQVTRTQPPTVQPAFTATPTPPPHQRGIPARGHLVGPRAGFCPDHLDRGEWLAGILASYFSIRASSISHPHA